MRRRLSDFRFGLLGRLILSCLLLGPSAAQAQRQHLVYFKDSPRELNVYKIIGREEGPTMMIIGGIQGNEPGGFLSADLYADYALKKGNLVVVPRANFQSILVFQRGHNGDMNRKFGPLAKQDVDAQIVRILKDLIAESDVLLNLHDGSGFYRPRYESPLANPRRYGQSVIADCEKYYSARLGRWLHLKDMAEKVITRINAQIENPRYRFHFMNTRTGEKDTPYAEQRLSATYYALTKQGIPAFGIETSKNLPTMEMKVYQHNLAINAFMEIFGLEPEQPRIYLVPPKLNYLVVSINNQVPVAVADRGTLFLNPGDSIEVVHVEANYERGLTADIQGLGTINDFRQRFTITKPTVIVAQKDHIKFGRVAVALRPRGPESPQDHARFVGPVRIKFFVVEVEGHRHLLADGEELKAVVGDRIKVVEVVTEGGPPGKDLTVNFKGFVPNRRRNTGEDRGYVINTATDLMARYSLSETEKVYAVIAEKGSKVLAQITIRFEEPKLDYLILRHNGGPRLCLHNGESLPVRPGDRVQVLDLKTNVLANSRISLQVKGPVLQENHPEALLAFKARQAGPLALVVTREGIILGKVLLPAG